MVEQVKKWKPVFTKAKQERMLELKKQGMGLGAVAKELGVSSGTLGYWWYKKFKNEGRKKNEVKRRKSSEGGHNALDVQQAYITGKVEQIVRGYAESLGIPFGTLAAGVAAGLRTFARR